MNDLITLLDFIAKGNGTIISSGQAKGLLNHITHIEQERDQLKEKLEIATGALNHYLYGGSDYSQVARDALNEIKEAE